MRKILCDLDGTLALIEHRHHFVEGDNKDWSAFFAACVDDEPNKSIIELEPNKPIIELVNSLYFNSCEIIIVSGRSNEVEEETFDWLCRHDVCFVNLIMRKKGDYTPDHVLKSQWITEHGWTPENTLLVLDDRDSVVKMWRDEGFTCLQVAEGGF